MLTKTLSNAKKKQRNILIKAMNNDIGSIDSAKDSWNPAQISERAKDISYIRSLVDTWNPAQLNEALRMLDLPVIDTWNPAQIEEQRRNLVFYLSERTLTGNPITLNILGNLTQEVTGLKVTMNPIQDLHGYSNPWAGGAGKNKFQNPATTDTINGVTFTVNTDGSITISGTASARADFYLYGTSTSYADMGISAGDYSINGGHADARIYFAKSGGDSAYTGSTELKPLSIASGDTFRTFVRVASDTAITTPITVYPMVCSSTETDATFAPYSNICPITGRTEASVTRTAGENLETHTHQYGQTVYGGVDDFMSGECSNEWGYIASYNGETLPGIWISDRDVYEPNTSPTTGAEVVYKLATPTTISTSAEEITLLKGENVLSTDGDSIELKYKQNF